MNYIQEVYDHIIYKYDEDDIINKISEIQSDDINELTELEIEMDKMDSIETILESIIYSSLEELDICLDDDENDILKEMLCDEWCIPLY
jgi:hypothetical protein